MRSIVSYAILFVACSASVVLAECSWVSWEEQWEIVIPKSDPVQQSSSWKIHDAYREYVECDKAKRDAWDTMVYILTKTKQENTGENMVVKQKDGSWVSLEVKRIDGSKSASSNHYRCLPGTIDPREMKSPIR